MSFVLACSSSNEGVIVRLMSRRRLALQHLYNLCKRHFYHYHEKGCLNQPVETMGKGNDVTDRGSGRHRQGGSHT